MKLFSLIITVLFFSPLIQAQKPICGKVMGKRYNKDTNERPYELSGFWIKQNTFDVRVTHGRSPELIDLVQELDGALFICLDEYNLEKSTYAKKVRYYVEATEYRVWLNGEKL